MKIKLNKKKKNNNKIQVLKNVLKKKRFLKIIISMI